MKIQTIAKHISIQVLLFGTLGIVYAAWNDTVSNGDPLTAASWNEVVDRVEAFTVSGGNVGIGAPSPTAKLDINGSIKFGNANTTTGAGIGTWALRAKHDEQNLAEFYYYNNTSNPRLDITADDDGITLASNYTTGAGELRFNGGGNEAMRISKIGNVGIGTATPGAKLDVTIPSSGGATVQKIARFLQTAQNTFDINFYGGSTDVVQLAATNAEQNISIVTESTASLNATTTKGIYIRSGGNVGIGTVAPTARLSVNGTANKSGGGTWAVFSDIRSKENIQNYKKGLHELLQLNPVTFKYKKEMNWGDTQVTGLIAQEVEKVVPSMVSSLGEVEGIENFKQLDPNELTYMLINAIKEQNKHIKKLQREVQILQNK